MVGGGNTAVEEALYLSNLAKVGDGHPSPRRVPRRAHPAGAAVREGQCEGDLGHGRGRDYGTPGKAPLPPSANGAAS